MRRSAIEAAPLLMARIYSYVVRYDSGFAPNPFYDYCTLATCKPEIRRTAAIGDWIVGSGSANKSVRRGGHLVYAMKVTEIMTFDAYADDPRFSNKKPYRKGSRKQSCGDNIYFRKDDKSAWQQLDSFHSRTDGTLNTDHVRRDTGVNRVLVSSDFVYFGGEGPRFPADLVTREGHAVGKSGIGYSCHEEPGLIVDLDKWVGSLGRGYQGAPFEWLTLRKK